MNLVIVHSAEPSKIEHIILRNKEFQKLKTVNNKKCTPELIFIHILQFTPVCFLNWGFSTVDP